MKYTIEQLPESQVAIDVEIEPEHVEKALDRAARRISQRARIPGFRPGKAPRFVVEGRYGRAALYEEASDELLQHAYREILETGEFSPVGKAQLEHLNLEPFSFRLIVPVRPTITLGDYGALRFEEKAEEVTEEDVQRVLEQLQEQQTIWKEPQPARPAREGDRVLVDLVGRVDEREIERQQQVELVLGDQGLLPGFREGLTGGEAGQTIQITTVLPEELDDEELAGQPAVYSVTVHTIREPEIPALDDEFAQAFGQEETLEEMRVRLQSELAKAAHEQARQRLLDEMLEALVEGAEVERPPILVDEEVDETLSRLEEQLKSLHIPMDRYLQSLGKTEEEYRQELRKGAEERVRRYLVMQEFIRAEGLSGEGEELRQQLEDRLLAIAKGEAEVAGGEETETGEPAAVEEQTHAEAAEFPIADEEAGPAAAAEQTSGKAAVALQEEDESTSAAEEPVPENEAPPAAEEAERSEP